MSITLGVMECIGGFSVHWEIPSVHWGKSSVHWGNIIRALRVVQCIEGISSVHWGIPSVR